MAKLGKNSLNFFKKLRVGGSKYLGYLLFSFVLVIVFYFFFFIFLKREGFFSDDDDRYKVNGQFV